MGLPAKLTLEEQALVNKYALLKKKKKAAATQKHGKKSIESNASAAPKKKDTSSPSKPPIDPKDAKEKAKQLLASGQLKISKGNDNRSFKRARGLVSEKKTKEPSLTEAVFSNKEQVKKIENIRRDSYNNFVSSNAKKDNSGSEAESKRFDNPRRQSNLFISGFGLTKNIMDTSFPQYGEIRNIYFDQDKSHGYVTYQRYEAAEKAIAELHGSMIEGVTLRVCYARKRNYDDNRRTWRPQVPRIALDDPDQSEQPKISTIPRLSTENRAKKPEAKPKRALVTYGDDDFDF